MTCAALLDTSAHTRNLGDEIIVRSIVNAVPDLAELTRVPTHWPLTVGQASSLRRADVLVFCGTNVLTPNLWRSRQWPGLSVFLPLIRNKVVFLGVGWGAPAPRLDRMTSTLLNQSSHPSIPIGVRDTLTLERALNSHLDASYIGCPTMWGLAEETPTWEGIREVVTTLTDYGPDPVADRAMLEFLGRRFDRVHFWPQGVRDLTYFARLSADLDIHLLDRSLDSFDNALEGRGYVGTRLHGGVRALQVGSPAWIISIDQRATAIHQDTGLPVMSRTTSIAEDLQSALETNEQVVLRLAGNSPWIDQLRQLLG